MWGMWKYKVQQEHAIPLAQATGVHSIDNCVVLMSTIGLQWQQGLLVISVAFPGLAAWDQGKQWWRVEPVVYTHKHIWLQGSAAGAFVVAGSVVNIHILIGPGQVASTGANYRLTPTAEALSVCSPMAAHSYAGFTLQWRLVMGMGWDMQVHSWSG